MATTLRWPDAHGIPGPDTWSNVTFTGTAPPAVVFYFSRDRGGEHPALHLESWQGILQADAHASYNRLHDPTRQPGPVTLALCGSLPRREFFELADVEGNIRKGKSAKVIC